MYGLMDAVSHMRNGFMQCLGYNLESMTHQMDSFQDCESRIRILTEILEITHIIHCPFCYFIISIIY